MLTDLHAPTDLHQPLQDQYPSPWINQGAFDPRMQPAHSQAVPLYNHHHWQINQFAAPGDFAPFPLDPVQQAAEQQSAQRVSYATQRGESIWQQPGEFYGDVAQEVPPRNNHFVGEYHVSPMDQMISPMAMQYGAMDRNGASSHYLIDERTERTSTLAPYSYHSSSVEDPSYAGQEHTGTPPHGPYHQHQR